MVGFSVEPFLFKTKEELQRDIVSYAKEKLSNSEAHSAMIMIRQYGKARTEEEAIDKIYGIIVNSMAQFFDASKRVLADPALGGRTEVEQALTVLAYVISGNACEFFCHNLLN